MLTAAMIKFWREQGERAANNNPDEVMIPNAQRLFKVACERCNVQATPSRYRPFLEGWLKARNGATGRAVEY